MTAARTVVASMVVAAVTLAGCTGQEDATDAPAADDVRPGVSAEDCDDPTLTQAEWTQFCVDAGLEGEAEANADPFTLANGEPKTFANGEVVTVTIEPWTPPAELGGYPTPPDALDDTYVKITTEVENRREVPVEIGTMSVSGPYSPAGEQWAWSLGWETRNAEGPIQPGYTGVDEEIYAAPEGDPGKELYLDVITPRIAGEAELGRSDQPETHTLHAVLP
jgi:hypothetical protein